MKNLLLPVLLLATLNVRAAAPEQTRQKLRSLAVLPSVSINVKMNTAELQNPDLAVGTNELTRRIVKLQKELRQYPDDAERQFQLGRYLTEAERKDEATEPFAKAVQLLRPRAENRPRDGALQAQFARALSEAGDGNEAERVLRAGIAAIPEDWACWTGLGEVLDNRELIALYGGTNRPPAGAPLEKQLVAMLPKKPTPELLKEAAACQDEADKCFDHAVALAPKEPQTYIARILHRSGHALVRQMLVSLTTGVKIDPKEWLGDMSSPEIIFDFARVVHLSPTNQTAIGCWGWTILTTVLTQGGDAKPIDRLPEDRRSNVLEAMRLLEGLGENPNPRVAASALEDLGMLRLMATLELEAAKAAFQRAVALEPSREQAWEGLVGLASRGDPHVLVSVCEQRVKFSDTVRNRVALAKACDNANLPEAALEHARAAVKLGPNNPNALVCLGALLLRRPEAPNAEAEIKQTFDAAIEGLKLMPASDETAQLAVTSGIDLAIMLALDGRLDSAREMLRNVASLPGADEKNKGRIKEIETVIGE